MRIISQDGKFDFPYDNSMLMRESNIIICIGSLTSPTPIASYSTAEKAQKAMEILHDFYSSNEFMKISGTQEIFVEIMKLVSQTEFDELTSSVFRFPADDEIEAEL